MTEDDVEQAWWEGYVEGISTVYRGLIMSDELSLADDMREGIENFNRTEDEEGQIKLDHVPYPPFN